MTSSIDNNRLDAALEWAARGFDVLPLHSIDEAGNCTCGKSNCASPGKHPLTSHGYLDASSDPSVIRDWFADYEAANIGVIPGSADCVVVDVDPRNAPANDIEEWLSSRAAAFEGAPVVRTGQYDSARGTHFWFRSDNAHTAGAGQLREGIEWKASSGYVLIPPSIHSSGATYELESGEFESVPEAPEWLETAMASKPSRSNARNQTPRRLTGLPIGKFALDAIEFGLIRSKDGQKQRDSAVGVARNLQQAGVPHDLVLVSMKQALLHPDATWDHDRPWTEDDAASIVDSVFAEVAPDQDQYLPPQHGHLIVRDLADAFAAEHVETKWLIRGLLTRGDKVVLAAQAKGKKTFLALHIARCVTTGEPFLGREDWSVDDPGPALFVEEEHNPPRWDERLRCVFDDARRAPFFYIHKPRFSLTNSAQVDQLIDHAVSIDARLIVLDPWQHVIPGLNENDAGETEPAFTAVHRIADESGAAVMILHHTNKAGSELGFDSIRGSSRMQGEVDVILLSAKRGKHKLEIRIEGRDIEIDADSTIMAEHEPDRPHALRFISESIKAKPRNRTREAAANVLQRASGWLTITAVEQSVEETLGEERSRETVRKVLIALADEGVVEKRVCDDGRETTEWKWVGQ